MKRKFTRLTAALALLVGLAIPLGMWGQSDYSTDYTGNVTLSATGGTSASTCKVVINNNEYDGVKAGTGSVSGAMKITVPADTKYLHLHVAGWKGDNVTLSVTPEGYSSNIGLTSDDGISGNSPFTFSGDPSTSDYYKVITFTNALEAATQLTFTATSGKRFVIWGVTSEEDSGGGDLQDNNLTLNPTSLSLDLYANANNHTGTINYTTSSTGAISVSESDYVTTEVNETNNTITVTPTAVTTSAQTITVSQAADDTYAAGSATFTVTVANSTPTVTVTYHANGGTGDDVEETPYQGSDYTVAANTFSYTGHSFTKWHTNEAGTGGTDYNPGDVIEGISADLDLYAQWEEVNEVVDYLDRAFTGITGGSGYGGWSGKEGTSGAVYAGNSAGGASTSNPSIQLRSSGNSGIITTASGGRFTKVTVTWNSSTSNGRTLNIYGKNSAYTGTSDLYNDNTAGTLIGTIVKGTSTELIINGSYTFIGMRSANNAMYLNEIQITWATSGTPAPSYEISNNDEIAYDATSGSFNFTVQNAVDGGVTTVAEEVEWISSAAVSGNSVTFNTTQNDAAANRSGVITLTYTYNTNETVTKDVTIVQSGNPDYTPTIAEVRAQGTGSVVTKGIVTSCVGTTGYIQDATAAICVYGTSLTVGDEIRVSGTLSTYHGLLEITNPQVTVISQENTVTPETMSVADAAASTNQGWYIRIEEATVTSISGQNTTIAQGASTIVVRGISGVEIAVNDVISLDGNIGCYDGNQIANPQNVEVQAVPSISLEEYSIETIADAFSGYYEVTYANLDIQSVSDFSVVFCDAEGTPLPDNPEWIITASVVVRDGLEGYWLEIATSANQGEARTTCLKVCASSVCSDVCTISQEAYVAPVPSITITPATLNVPAAAYTIANDFPITYEHIVVDNYQSFGIQFYNANNEELQEVPDWLIIQVAGSNAEGYKVIGYIAANTATEARNAYFKVHALDAGANLVYSNLVTITQAEYVVDYAELPFNWAGGSSSAFNALTGVTTFGLGSDYAASNAPYLIKLDGTGDYIQIKTNEQPGVVTIGVKMLGGTNTSTITVQGSADGQTFADVEYLTISGTSTTTELTLETTNDFASTHRYVRLLFTKGSNVGVGPITITQVDNTPSITLSTYEVNVDAAEHDGTINVTYKNVEVDQTSIYFCDANGDDATYGDWIQVAINNTNNNVDYVIGSNTGEARTAYFKVYSMDAGTNLVYSDIVTVSQAAPVPTYVVSFELDGGTFVPTDVFTDDIVEVEAGTYALPSATKTGSSFAGWKLDGTETIYAGGQDYEVNDDASFTAQWTAATTYSLVTSMDQIVSGKHYIIASGTSTSTSVKAMGEQGSNNRAAVTVSVSNNQIQETTGVYEFVINGPEIITKNDEEVEVYTIYDANYSTTGGYLHAATSSSSNYLKTRQFNSDANSQWTISINTSTGQATIKAQGNFTKNWMRYNSGSSIFSCYASGQNDIYLYVKDVNPSYDYYKDIAAYTGTNDNYRLIASPVAANPAEVTGMTDGTFDLYYFDQAEEEEWRNYEAENGEFNLAPGKGYLYANNADVTLHFNGTPAEVPTVTLAKSGNGIWKGWNLVGNPFGHVAYIIKDYYRMNAAGNEIELGQGAINPMEGVFVVANEDEEVMTFYPTQPLTMNNDVVVNITNGNNVIDRAIVSFGEGRQLPKFQLNPKHTKVYIPQGDNDYAIVSSNAEGEMPVSFKAENNGTYTFSVNTENVEMTYLHLIDNLTGADVDLLANPSYSFEAKTTDYASRFKLVFAANEEDGPSTSSGTFAFYNGSEWVISNMGEATLQVVDVMGRVVSTETVSGNATMNTNSLSAGIYMMRLINGNDVKVQKIVVR